MLKEVIADLLAKAASEAQKQGKIPYVSLPEIVVEHPQDERHGDYASSLPLKLARATSTNPLAIAKEIVALIPPTPEIDKAVVAPPGFINFILKSDWLNRQVANILDAGDSYGTVKQGNDLKVQIEFVSVNPTGPLHVGHGRGAVLGSTLANVLTAADYNVEKEYYINDGGSQMAAFTKSLYARYMQEFGEKIDLPTDGYQGGYMVDIAKEVVTEYGDKFRKIPENDALVKLEEIGLKKTLAQIEAELTMLGVTFDVWFSEKSLFKNGQYATAMAKLAKDGYITKREGATWFVSTALGEDKDNVVVRTDGSPTYFATDIAYHYDKFLIRKFDRVINIWGADHMGHVSRMKAVVGALGIDPERLRVIISQLVTLRRGGEIVRLSKRSGDIITLRELIEEVGADACRFFFLSRTADAQMDFDMELAKKQSADNPVYYVQYAHARIASILRLAEEKGVDFSDGDISLLTCDAELALIRKMLQMPEIIQVIAETLEPHHLTYYAQDLATVFHSFYKQCRVVSPDKAVTCARLKLVKAAKQVLARTLHLMGMNAPDKM